MLNRHSKRHRGKWASTSRWTCNLIWRHGARLTGRSTCWVTRPMLWQSSRLICSERVFWVINCRASWLGLTREASLSAPQAAELPQKSHSLTLPSLSSRWKTMGQMELSLMTNQSLVSLNYLTRKLCCEDLMIIECVLRLPRGLQEGYI